MNSKLFPRFDRKCTFIELFLKGGTHFETVKVNIMVKLILPFNFFSVAAVYTILQGFIFCGRTCALFENRLECQASSVGNVASKCDKEGH